MASAMRKMAVYLGLVEDDRRYQEPYDEYDEYEPYEEQATATEAAPARPAFARLREIAGAVRAQYPQATAISAGMSGDLEDAIAEGATLVRIGTALLGGRRAFVR